MECSAGLTRFQAIFLLFALAATGLCQARQAAPSPGNAGNAQMQPMAAPLNHMQPYQEYSQKIRAAELVPALTSDLFGEGVTLYDQSVVFRHVDVDIPGSNALPVRLSRSLAIRPIPFLGQPPEVYGGAGDWDVDVPRISGVFDSAYKWNVEVGGSRPRCSNSFVPRTDPPHEISEIWSGYIVTIPGQGPRSLIGLPPSQYKKPDSKTRLWTTSALDAVSCTPMTGGYPGEGFVLETTEGLTYTFNVATERNAGKMGRDDSGLSTRVRVEVLLLASKIEDRFGNWVTYAYNATGHPVSISGSDGRHISLTYSNGRLSSASAHGQNWSYTYNGSVLQNVTLPDQSSWQFTHLDDRRIKYERWTEDPGPSCGNTAPLADKSYTLQMRHPSGAVGRFQFGHQRLYRAGIPVSYCVAEAGGGSTVVHKLAIPNYFDVLGLVAKGISGPGIASEQVWSYADLGSYQGLWSGIVPPCTSCTQSKRVRVVQPDGSKVEEEYGIVFSNNEGRLLGRYSGPATGGALRSETLTYMTNAEAATAPFPAAYGSLWGGNDESSVFVRPLRKKEITESGITFAWEATVFDAFARPVTTVSSSALAPVARTDTTQYHDNTAKWILGQVAKVTNGNTGLVERQTSYDGNAMPLQNHAFGKLQQTLTYNADGTVATVKDGNNNLTTLSSWKRGIPQSITFADGKTRSAIVNDSGWLTQVSDENGYATHYTYDGMGRLASIAYPTGDSTAWNTTTQVFEPVNAAEYGIAAGHWRQTVSSGNARKLTYFDALWRPLLTREYDAADEASTQRFQRFAYDHEGRVSFASYPGASATLTTGTWNEYDALGRPTSVSQDSELGLLTTLTQYLSGFQTRVTNPRGQQTTTSFMAWDQPTTDYPIAVVQPEGVYTDIARDVFGKPTAITQRNAASSVSVTRRYVYDSYQQLCKSIEPETASTVMAYDNAGNLSWSASGQALPSASSCDSASVAANQKVSRSYDARNRLTALTFPDNNGNQSWTYTADGLPNTVTTQNEGGNSTVTNSYAYNKRRLLTSESQSQTAGQAVWSIDYGYNGNGHLSSLVYPQSLTVDYAPNALGQPTKAGSFATGVQYYPNGAIKQFTYGNGRVHTMTQNARQLPSRSTDSGSVLDLVYAYDQNGNVASMTDYTPAGRQTRSMSYDNRDRLTAVTSPLYPGGASYAYDVLDNLTRVALAGRNHHYWYDANNRLTNVLNGAGGPSVIGLGYDARGNLNNKNGQLYTFDHGNRLRTALGTQTYRYDALGRRVRTSSPSGLLYEVYSQDGKLLWQRDEQAGQRLHHIYLGGSLVATRRMPIGDTTASVTYQHTDALGSPIATTNEAGTVTQTTEHEPYGHQLNRSNDNRPGYTGHVMDQATGLVQMQQRYYDPMIGRFLSVDPVTAYERPANFNRYDYVLNNPYKFTDPDGRCEGGRNKPQACDVDQSNGRRATPQPVTVKNGVPPPKGELKIMLQCTANCSNSPLRVTSTDEAIPQHKPGTPHRRGEAADVTIQPADRKAVLQCAANCGAKFGLNEYARPSPKATGGHIHLQLGPGKSGGRGDLPAPTPTRSTPAQEEN